MTVFQTMVGILFALTVLIFCGVVTIKNFIEIRNYLKSEKDHNIKIVTYVLIFLMSFPIVIYIMDKYNLPTKLHFVDDLISKEAWFDFLSSYVGTVVGTIFSAIVLLIVTKMQIKKTFENEKKKDEIENYKREKSLLNLYKETIIETRDNIDTFFGWLKKLKDLELKDPDGNKINVYLIEYNDFVEGYWFDIAEGELKNAYTYVEDNVLKEIVFMIGQSRYVLNTISDNERKFNYQIMKAEKIKAIEQEIDNNTEKSILNVLDKTEKIINKRIIEIENIIEEE